VIFLDIDGVLAPIRRWDRYGDLDPECVRVLNDIVARGDAEVVVSSTWRYGKTAGRADEIAAWLAEHDVSGYAIIDDHADMGALRRHLVQTQPAHGLQSADAARVIEILMRPAAR
jgi:hypothetical protein